MGYIQCKTNNKLNKPCRPLKASSKVGTKIVDEVDQRKTQNQFVKAFRTLIQFSKCFPPRVEVSCSAAEQSCKCDCVLTKLGSDKNVGQQVKEY